MTLSNILKLFRDADQENLGEALNRIDEANKDGFLVDCGNFSLRFDDNGLLNSFKRDDLNNEEIKLKMHYGYYIDNGGAYVFAPNEHQVRLCEDDVEFLT